jgi:hypothetical protein
MSVKSANETEGRLLSTRDLNLFSSDEWQKFTTETIEIRNMVYTYRKKSRRDSRRRMTFNRSPLS